jgi:hypothetical protein
MVASYAAPCGPLRLVGGSSAVEFARRFGLTQAEILAALAEQVDLCGR